MPKPDAQRPYLDTDNQERYGKVASDLGVSVSWIVNTALRNVRLEIVVTAHVKQPSIKVGDKTIITQTLESRKYTL